MSRYGFRLKNREIIDNIRSPYIYEFNLARNLALLSNDPAVIRYFYQIDAPKFMKDQWLQMEVTDKFLAQYRPGQAFAYFGICPMIVQAKVNLLASTGFECQSNDKEIDEILNKAKDDARLEQKFADGVYWESGIGDFAYRLSYNPKVSKDPIITVIEPQHLEVNYAGGKIKSFVIKEVSGEDSNYELHELWYKNTDNKVVVEYKFFYDGKYVSSEDKALIDECRLHFDSDIDLTAKVLPFDDFMIVFKKNANANQLYRGERGVPDIQGLDTIEDALTETASDLIDAIRKGGVKEYVSEELIPQDEKGNDLRLDHFNKTIITTKGSSNPANPKALWNVVQGDIKWEAYIQTMQTLISTAINKAGLSPTTLGLTGLESINSSAESQEARERTSLRRRELDLKEWALTLKDLLNKYLQMKDYIAGREILDYSDLIKIHFNDYVTPSVENITDVLAAQVSAGIKSQKHAIKELNDGYEDEDAENELLDIMAEQGRPVLGGQPTAEDMENNAPKNVNLENSDSSKKANLENSDSIKG